MISLDKKCMGTSQNLVSTLFPRLISAVQENELVMALQYLEKARRLILINSEKVSMTEQEWTQLKKTYEGMVLAKKKIELGIVPNPDHLGEVQDCLSKIQDILNQLKSFWEKVNSMLDLLQEKTFVDEDLIDDPEEKELFVSSIQEATKIWKSFGCFCGEATGIFQQQNKEGYKFLETDPTSLSKEAWQLEYDSVLEQLKNVNTGNECVAAISE